MAERVTIHRSNSQTSADITLQQLDFGGREGKKYIAQLTCDHQTPNSIFVKEYPLPLSQIEDEMKEIQNTYEMFAELGYLVPKNVVYFEYDGKSQLGMEEMRNGGEYLLWAYSDKQNPKELSELLNMEVTRKTFDEEIIPLVIELAIRVTQDGLQLDEFNYFIRKSIKTGKFEIGIFDLYIQEREPQDLELNVQEAIGFIRRLKSSCLAHWLKSGGY